MITTPEEDCRIHALKQKIDRFDFHRTIETIAALRFLHETLVRVKAEAERLQRENQDLHHRIRNRS
jgi:hypothetical protein